MLLSDIIKFLEAQGHHSISAQADRHGFTYFFSVLGNGEEKQYFKWDLNGSELFQVGSAMMV
ncbi:hypothetical protein [Dyadobacter sp. CY312]|uniref:hypothetical protein n=1 Tax=Dyadobacter sp. CY312 TaxID=2907303 RepID=UPI001F43C268|nr:hypothetical protein [Dyadobacter sp. CY312]MCE7039181.1 hypothetical protein [Dyadobacter sp. CY312]